MCGRFVQSVDETDWQALVRAQGAMLTAAPARRFNVAPTQPVVGLAASTSGPTHESFRFGMTARQQGLVINARAETVHERPMFRGLLARGRALVMASAFYEWAPAPPGSKKKVPCAFSRADAKPFWLAALVRAEADMPGCVLLTTSANEMVLRVHPRMPVMLEEEAARTWLDGNVPVERALPLLHPYAGAMRGWTVGLEVNRARNDDAQCLAPTGELS